jgi:hypothetical protein
VPGSHRRFLAARSGTQVEDLLAQGWNRWVKGFRGWFHFYLSSIPAHCSFQKLPCIRPFQP